ncbi:PaaI family thioesterase [Rhizobium binae]|uniref:PaaI family thioesterase n=1 Tax=Rhizobium binae TaxID=1138190 RepID=UPI003DA8BB26
MTSKTCRSQQGVEMTGTREERNWKALNAGAFMAMVGPLTRVQNEDGSFVYALQTRHEHENALGLIHGGVITALLDQAISMVAWTAADRAPTVTVQMDTRFVSAAKPGTFLEARAKIRHQTGSLMFLDAEVSDGEHTVALATAVMKILRKAA